MSTRRQKCPSTHQPNPSADPSAAYLRTTVLPRRNSRYLSCDFRRALGETPFLETPPWWNTKIWSRRETKRRGRGPPNIVL